MNLVIIVNLHIWEWYRIASGKLSRVKSFTNRWNMRFREQNFRRFATDWISASTHPQSMKSMHMCNKPIWDTPLFCGSEKTFTDGPDPWNSQSFLPRKYTPTQIAKLLAMKLLACGITCVGGWEKVEGSLKQCYATFKALVGVNTANAIYRRHAYRHVRSMN